MTKVNWYPYPNSYPSNSRQVLVSYNWKGLFQNEEDDFEVSIGEYWPEDNGFGKFNDYVTAWAEMPEPYKP